MIPGLPRSIRTPAILLAAAAMIGFSMAPPAHAGMTESSQVRSDAGAMSYDVYVPSSYSASSPAAPLVVALHGGGESLAHTAELTGWNLLAEEYGFIVVYPKDPSATGLWGWSDAVRRGRDDPAGSLVALVTATVSNDFNIDRKRVLITGQSAGAGMAVAVAVSFAELYSAIGVEGGCAFGYVLCMGTPGDPLHAGDLSRLYFSGEAAGAGAYSAMGGFAHRLPAIVSYGDRDVESAVVGQDALVTMWLAVNDWIDDGAANQSVARTPQRTVTGNENGADYVRELHADADGCDLVERWVIAGLEHAYSGARDADGNNGLGPDMRRRQYEFLMAQTSGATACASATKSQREEPRFGGALPLAGLAMLMALALVRLRS